MTILMYVHCVPTELKCSSTLGREVSRVNVCGLFMPLPEKNPKLKAYE